MLLLYCKGTFCTSLRTCSDTCSTFASTSLSRERQRNVAKKGNDTHRLFTQALVFTDDPRGVRHGRKTTNMSADRYFPILVCSVRHDCVCVSVLSLVTRLGLNIVFFRVLVWFFFLNIFLCLLNCSLHTS